MLTRDLLRARAYKGAVRCQFLDPADDDVLADARFLCDLVQRALESGSTSGAIEDEIAAEAQVRPDHKQLRGLAKVLLDTSAFEQESLTAGENPIPPAELRERVFRRAAELAPLALSPNPFGRPTAREVLEAIAAELSVEPDALARALYADRKAELRIAHTRFREPEALIQRYNVALAQSLLLRAVSVRITLTSPPAARVRQLLRVAKFNQLMHRATLEGDDLILVIDGPETVLQRSTRYGLRLATFFPTLLHQDRWVLEAEVAWTKGTRTLTLSPEQGLVPHVRDQGGQAPREAGWFSERFEQLDTGWTLEEGRLPLDLGGRAVVMPDFTFSRDGRVAHLEIIGFWRRDYLDRRIEWLRAWGPGNLILAVSKRLVADDSALDGFEGEVIPFAEIISAKKVLEAVERIAL